MLTITNPNSSGQGYCSDYPTHPLTRVVEEWGYKYSHSVYVAPLSGTPVMHHCFKLGEHNVSFPHYETEHYHKLWSTSCSCASGHELNGSGIPELEAHLKRKNYQYKLVKPVPSLCELMALIKEVKASISPAFRAFEGDEIPGIQLTIGWSPDSGKWSYQTGDNSYTGGAYSHPVWAVVGVYRRSCARQIAGEIQNELEEGRI